MIPGIYPSIVNPILIKRSQPHPLSNRTPSGGKNIAQANLHISLHVNGIFNFQKNNINFIRQPPTPL